MEICEDQQDDVGVEEIAYALGVGAMDAARIRPILIEAMSEPERSVLAVEQLLVISESDLFRGFRKAWWVLYKQCLVLVVETWERNRGILNAVPLAVH